MSSEAIRRTEAKALFANERTFLHWLNISVTLGSIAAAMLGISGHVHRHFGSQYTENALAARLVAGVMMVISIFVAMYASFKFAYRGSLMKFKVDTGYEDRVLPLLMSVSMSAVLVTIFAGALRAYRNAPDDHYPPAEPPSFSLPLPLTEH